MEKELNNYLIKDLINIVDEYSNDNREKYDLVMIHLLEEMKQQRFYCDSGMSNNDKKLRMFCKEFSFFSQTFKKNRFNIRINGKELNNYLVKDLININREKYDAVMREFTIHINAIVDDYNSDNCFCDGSCGDHCSEYWGVIKQILDGYPNQRNSAFNLQLNKIVKNGLSLIANKH